MPPSLSFFLCTRKEAHSHTREAGRTAWKLKAWTTGTRLLLEVLHSVGWEEVRQEDSWGKWCLSMATKPLPHRSLQGKAGGN